MSGGFLYHPLNRICFTPTKDAYISEFYANKNFGDRSICLPISFRDAVTNTSP
jgi:hypothetical protein